jgi:hypothetical protein
MTDGYLIFVKASKSEATKDRQLASGSPVLPILGTDNDEP